jgi:predicted alpha-1,6-mannanase (GH76 family)
MFSGSRRLNTIKILSDWQSRQVVETDQRFRDRLTLLMETESVTELQVTTIPGADIGSEGF